VSAVDLVHDLIELEQLAEQERDAARRRRLVAVANRVADRDAGAKVADAARILGVSAPTVRAWIEAGVLATVPERSPVRVQISSLAATKRAVDSIHKHKDDRHLLVDVLHMLRDRAALAGRDVTEGIEDLRAGRLTKLDRARLDELLSARKRRRPSKST
jgi:Helix-turn-helix domain